MKLKKLTLPALAAALLVSCFSLPTSAANLAVKKNYDVANVNKVATSCTAVRELKEADAIVADYADFGIDAAHLVWFDGGQEDNLMTYITPMPFYIYDKDDTIPDIRRAITLNDTFGQVGEDEFDAFEYGVDVPYIAFKFEADEGKVIKEISGSWLGQIWARYTQNDAWGRATLSVFLDTEIHTDDNGYLRVDEAQFVQNWYATGVEDMGNYQGNRIDQTYLDTALRALGKQKTVYVIVAMWQNADLKYDDPASDTKNVKMSGYDTGTSMRLTGVDLTATQCDPSEITDAPSTDTQAADTTASGTQTDNASSEDDDGGIGIPVIIIIAVAAVAVVAGVIVVITKKKK